MWSGSVCYGAKLVRGDVVSCGCAKNILNLKGQVFGRLTVVEEAGRTKASHVRWRCLCECGKECITTANNLRTGHTRSCSCLQKDRASKGDYLNKRNRTHGMTGTKTYKAWRSMLYRCLSTTAPNYSNYGGRGITICDRWVNSFENFYEDMGDAPVGLSLDRVNNDGNYEPSNCRWATMLEQANNRRPMKKRKR